MAARALHTTRFPFPLSQPAPYRRSARRSTSATPPLRLQLKHDGTGRFVSHDGRFKLQFGLDDRGDPQLVCLTLPAPLV